MTSVAYQVHLIEETKRDNIRKKKFEPKFDLVLPVPQRHEALYIDPYIDAMNKKTVSRLQEKINRMKEKQK